MRLRGVIYTGDFGRQQHNDHGQVPRHYYDKPFKLKDEFANDTIGLGYKVRQRFTLASGVNDYSIILHPTVINQR